MTNSILKHFISMWFIQSKQPIPDHHGITNLSLNILSNTEYILLLKKSLEVANPEALDFKTRSQPLFTLIGTMISSF